MRGKSIVSLRAALLLNAGCFALVASTAQAQSQGQAVEPQADKAVDHEIVVTGTLLRGAAPVGSSMLSVGQTKLAETGAISSNELLATIPQVSNYFNRVPLADIGGAAAVNQVQVSRPNLRNISPYTASSSATLILLDGHRIASVGVNQASVDPDLIPTGVIERVEVVTEGGSATYGADAVAGVINFITRKRFDGLKVDAHYGLASKYWQWDASATAGKSWDGGSAYISYTYTGNGSLFGRDRSFIHNLDYTSQPYLGRDLTCANPNLAVNTVLSAYGVTIGSTNYAGPNYTAGTTNRCDNSQNSTYIPSAQRNGVMAGWSQTFGPSTSLDVRAFFSSRKTESRSDLYGTVAVGGNNPYAASYLPAGLLLGTQPYTIFGSPVVNQASVSFNLSPLTGVSSGHSGTLIKEWGANAELKQDLGSNFQARVLGNWSHSDSSYYATQISPSGLAAAGVASTTATAFNPFNVVNNNPTLISQLLNSELAGQAVDDLLNFRLITEGKLFDLPAGDLRVALGYEFMHDRLEQRYESDIPIGGLGGYPFTAYSRNVHALFGEFRVPVVADRDGRSMLNISASGRYDHYSDFGSTFNPKIGTTFKPLRWFTLRGNWGTSFTAPTPLDQLGSLRNTLSSYPFVPFTNGSAVPSGAWTIALQGSKPNLKPQTAHTWSVGIDVDPISKLHASVNYYDVNFKDILSTPTASNSIFTDFPNNVATSANGFSAAQLLAYGALAPGGAAVVNPLIAGGTTVYEFVDFRTGNFGILHVKGIDFALNYAHKTGFGSVDFSVSGNRPLSRKQQASPTSTVIDQLATGYPKLYLQTSLGTNVGNLRAQATWNFTGGYALTPTTSVPVQTRVGSFSVFNLFFKYDIPASRDLSLTLNLNNVFDTNPPVLRSNNPGEVGFGNGFTLGRMFMFGISKKI